MAESSATTTCKRDSNDLLDDNFDDIFQELQKYEILEIREDISTNISISKMYALNITLTKSTQKE